MTDRERAESLTLMSNCRAGTNGWYCEQSKADAIEKAFAAVRAEARREALEEARAVVDEERMGQQHAAYQANANKNHDDESLYDYANGILCIVSTRLHKTIRSLLSTEPRDTQGDGGRR